MKKVLILGAMGFIGKSLVEKLSSKYRIIAFDYVESNIFDGNQNVEYVKGNFVTKDDFSDLLMGVDKVIHLISTTTPKDTTDKIIEEVEENVLPTIRLLESMVSCNVKEIIFSSSAGTVYGETGNRINSINAALNPKCSYGVQKCVIEQYLSFYSQKYGIKAKIVRITNPYGWGQDKNKMQGIIPIFVNRFFNDEEITVFGDGSHQRDYVFITDLINSLAKVMEYDGEERIFNIGYGEYYSINDIIHFIENRMHKRFKKINYVGDRGCDVHRSYVDVSSTQQLLGWYPEISIHRGIELTVEKLLRQNV